MTTSVHKDPLRIALVRLSEATAAMIGMVIERFARAEFAIVTQGEAQALVVDADRHFGTQSLANLQSQHPRLPLVLLSTHDLSLENAVTLRKPIRIQEFLAAVRSLRASGAARERPAVLPTELAGAAAPASATPELPDPAPLLAEPAQQQLEAATASREGPHGRAAGMREARRLAVVHDCCGDAPDSSAAALCDPANAKANYFDDRTGLLGTLRAAAQQSIEQNKTMTVLGLPDALYVSPASFGQVITQLDDDMLRATCTPSAEPDLRFCSIAAVPQAARSWRRIRLATLVWDLSLQTARGRLPANVGAHARLRLKAWPNFTRLTLTPHALRIAALWATGYMSPIEVAKRLDVAQRYVFALCAAAEIAGLFEREPRPTLAAAPIAPPTIVPDELPQIAPNPARNLLKRILGKLLHAR